MTGKGIIYVDQMFNYRGAAQASLAGMYAGTTTTVGTYAPQLSGTLIKITVITIPQAASSLAQDVRVELSQTNWLPNTLRFPMGGFGLATAPQLYGGAQAQVDFVVNQPVQTDWPITGNSIAPGTSPVTPAIVVVGYFAA